MSFNTCIRVGGGLPTGRYIGAGRDKSGPTGVPYPLGHNCEQIINLIDALRWYSGFHFREACS